MPTINNGRTKGEIVADQIQFGRRECIAAFGIIVHHVEIEWIVKDSRILLKFCKDGLQDFMKCIDRAPGKLTLRIVAVRHCLSLIVPLASDLADMAASLA